ncbi:hypothetical protein MBANPS3_012419 [Mucor bainieri]
MITVTRHGATKDIWVGDIIKTVQKLLVVHRFFTLQHDEVMIEGYELETLEGEKQFRCVEKIVVKAADVVLVVRDDVSGAALLPPLGLEGDNLQLCCDEMKKIQTPSPLKRLSPVPGRKYMSVKVIPLNLFTDDMGGNRTKKHNKFDSWIMVPAALPLSKRQALENTAFICTDHFPSAMEMFPALVCFNGIYAVTHVSFLPSYALKERLSVNLI